MNSVKEAKDSGGEGEFSPRPAPSDGSLVGRELDAAVATRVMGFEEVEQYGDRVQYHNPVLDAKWGGRWNSEVPCYSTDITAAMQVEDRIAEMGAIYKVKYVDALRRIPTVRAFVSLFDLIHATPEQRCRAALEAVALNVPERDAEITTVR